MRRALLTLLIGSLLVPASVCAQTPAQGVEPAVVQLTIQLEAPTGEIVGTGYCSAFSVNAPKNLFLTDAHCIHFDHVVTTGLKLNGYNAYTVFLDTLHDLAVVQCYGVNTPSLHPSGIEVERGLPVTAWGYGYGWADVMARAGIVSIPFTQGEDLQEEEHQKDAYTVFAVSFIGGMSGGPVVNTSGQVVGIIQRSNEYLGVGRTMGVVLSVTRPFWEFGS